MSDPEIRRLERSVKDDPADLKASIALIRARVRAGLLSQKCVDTAAQLGDEAARTCASDDLARCLVWEIHTDREEALKSLPKITLARIGCDWAEAVLPVWEARFPGDARPRRAIEAARAGIANSKAACKVIWKAALDAWTASDACGDIHDCVGDGARESARAIAVAAAIVSDSDSASAGDTARVAQSVVEVAVASAVKATGSAEAALEAADTTKAAQKRDVIRALLSPPESENGGAVTMVGGRKAMVVFDGDNTPKIMETRHKYFTPLDARLSKGGFLPDAWAESRPPKTP